LDRRAVLWPTLFYATVTIVFFFGRSELLLAEVGGSVGGLGVALGGGLVEPIERLPKIP
jgi:hypothetical protein